MSISYARDLFMTRIGVYSGLEKHRFHQAKDPCSPDLRRSAQTFDFVCVSIKERSWLRFIKRTGSKGYFFLQRLLFFK